MHVHAAYPTEVKEKRVSPRSASQSPTARRVQFMVPSRSSSTSRDDSSRIRSVYTEESRRNCERDVSWNRSHGRPYGDWRSFEDRSRMPSRGHGKERQMDYEGVNTSFGLDVAVYVVCHRHGHFARECPGSTQRCRRGGRQDFGSDQCHQSRVR